MSPEAVTTKRLRKEVYYDEERNPQVDRTDHREYRIGYSHGPRSNKLHGLLSKERTGLSIEIRSYFILEATFFWGMRELGVAIIGSCRHKWWEKIGKSLEVGEIRRNFAASKRQKNLFLDRMT